MAERALALDKHSGYAWNAMACAYAAAGNFTAAAEAQHRAMEDPSYALDDAMDGGRHAVRRLDYWRRAEIWTSDVTAETVR
jgi:hypothetical protein